MIVNGRRFLFFSFCFVFFFFFSFAEIISLIFRVFIFAYIYKEIKLNFQKNKKLYIKILIFFIEHASTSYHKATVTHKKKLEKNVFLLAILPEHRDKNRIFTTLLIASR